MTAPIEKGELITYANCRVADGLPKIAELRAPPGRDARGAAAGADDGARCDEEPKPLTEARQPAVRRTAELRRPTRRCGRRCTKMYLIRRFEEGAEESYMRGLIHGTMHLSIGQEASAVGIVHAAAPTTTRSPRPIAATATASPRAPRSGAMFAEFFGKRTAIATAAAARCTSPTSSKRQSRRQRHRRRRAADRGRRGAVQSRSRSRTTSCMSFFGDGATNEGAFHEALNMASIWKLPVVFVCENNEYGMSTSTARSTAVPNVADRAAAYAMPGVIVDGNDLLGRRRRVAAAVARARAARARR